MNHIRVRKTRLYGKYCVRGKEQVLFIKKKVCELSSFAELLSECSIRKLYRILLFLTI